MSDPFASVAPSIDGPFVNVYQVTPADEAPLPLAARKLLVISTEASPVVRVTTAGQAEGEFVDVPAWIFEKHLIRVVKVWATGTVGVYQLWALV